MIAPLIIGKETPCRDRGFSLIELIVVVALLGLIVAVLGPVFTTQLTISRRFEKVAREIDDSSRLQHLLETEVSESGNILYNQSLPSTCSSAGTSLFTLPIPYGYNSANGLPNLVNVHYYQLNSLGGFYRCGPPVSADGSLITSSSIEPVLITRNIYIAIDPTSDPEYMVYQIKNSTGSSLQSGSAYSLSGVVR